MIMAIVSDAELELLLEQKSAAKARLRRAYRSYFARVAGQEAGEAHLVDSEEIAPLEAEFMRVHASIMAYVARGARREENTP